MRPAEVRAARHIRVHRTVTVRYDARGIGPALLRNRSGHGGGPLTDSHSRPRHGDHRRTPN